MTATGQKEGSPRERILTTSLSLGLVAAVCDSGEEQELPTVVTKLFVEQSTRELYVAP